MSQPLIRSVLPLLVLLLFYTQACAQMQQGDGIWIRNAYYGEFQTFDKCYGHQPGNGQYHHHVHPICLRAQLDDNLVTVSAGRTGTSYREKTSGWKHSPILGWSFDGYPIYGPYGYSDPMNSTSAVRRMKTGFRLRAMTQRTALPDWALAHHTGVSQQLSAAQYGPDVSDLFPLGRYVEDFEFVQSIGDLDQYNGRFAVTPEFPGGTYAYYVTIDENGAPAFPYILGMQYYGAMNGSGNAAAPLNAQTYFSNGALAQPLSTAAQLGSWQTKNSLQEAKIVSGFDPSTGPKTTWPVDVPAGGRTSGSVTSPAKADVQTISYTDADVYIASNNLGSYTMGPWFIDGSNGGVFQNFPSVQSFRARIPRAPAATTNRRTTGLGAVGIWVNGVAVFNVLDGSSYSNASKNDLGGGPVRPSSLHVSAASFEGGPAAPGSLMTAFSLFGAKLSQMTAAADSPSWPVSLGGTTVTVRDAAGIDHAATISFASPTQVNYRVPESVATGLATVTISANGTTIPGAINIQPIYPNLFSLNSEGLAAGLILRVRNNQQTYEPIYRVNAAGAVESLPINLGPATDQVYLILFGTGLGKAGLNPSVTATIGGGAGTVAYAGPQGGFTGLDQFNLLLPRTLASKGAVEINLVAGGKTGNSVKVMVQ